MGSETTQGHTEGGSSGSGQRLLTSGPGLQLIPINSTASWRGFHQAEGK